MDRYAVIGHPVEHSRSPFIHACFAQATGQALSYERIDSPPGAFAATLRAFADSGARGCNVTLPFKGEAFALAAHASERARLARAVNTLRFDDADWFGDNTDGVGLVRDITRNAGVALGGRRLLLVGAGGAAAGVLGALIEQRPAAIALVNRSADKARALLASHRAIARSHGVALDAAPLAAPGAAHDVVINATSSSLQGAPLTLPAGVLAPGGLAIDLMYGPAARPFIDWARSQGGVGRDGLGMLVEQAAESFAIWRGERPETAPVLAALRARLAAATP